MCRLRLFILFLFIPLALFAQNQEWRVSKSTHFLVYYKNSPEDLLNKLMDSAENYYNKIADELGFTRFNFWTWDARAKIYIYNDAQDYQKTTGEPAWSAGRATVKHKIIETFAGAQGFLDGVLPHEMAHIIFREFVGFDNYAIPLWLDEGVASYQEKLKFAHTKIYLLGLMKSGEFMDLEKLSGFNPDSSQDNQAVKLFYAEAYSLVDYLIQEFGRDKFVLFCQNLRDLKNLQRAIVLTYSFASMKDFGESWQDYLKK
ncbi:hypothetical protein D4R78_02125 [bacterium]|nr:MAG: hypothetical protein D4R78_02125 [bacterium]